MSFSSILRYTVVDSHSRLGSPEKVNGAAGLKVFLHQSINQSINHHLFRHKIKEYI